MYKRQAKCRRRERINELRESEHTQPAHPDVKHRGKPFRAGDPEGFYKNADNRDRPDERAEHRAGFAPEHEQTPVSYTHLDTAL